MINNIAVYTGPSASEHNRKIVELYQFLKEYSSIPTNLNPEPNKLQNSYVFTSNYRGDLLNLDDSNKLIYMCRGSQIQGKQWLLMPSVDLVITNTYYEGLHISWQLQSKGFNTRVIHLIPWSIPKPLKGESIYYHALESRYRNAFWGRELQNTNPQAPIRVILTEKDKAWPYNVIEGMLSGAVMIVPDRPPYNEFIIDGYNGFLVRNPGDVVRALRKIDENQYWISYNAKNTIHAQLNHTKYLDTLLHSNEAPEVKLKPIVVESNQRRWLVRERTFQDGALKFFPERHGPNFTVIDLTEIQEILGYFLTQSFAEVYIFGADIPEQVEKKDLIQLMRMLNRIGSRSMKIHFCRDEPIPQTWEKVFARLSIISVEEGLKQVLS